MKEAKLGDKVKDKVSGFKGIVVSAHNYLNGCTRLTVQPKMKKDGTLPNNECFDAPQLIVLKEEQHSRGNITTGGPSKYEDKDR